MQNVVVNSQNAAPQGIIVRTDERVDTSEVKGSLIQ